MLAVSVVALLGLIALATEAGTWYLTRARAQDAADAAAWAAALTGTTAAATDVASQNGYASGVAVHNPPSTCALAGSKCSTSNTSQYEVVIQVSVTPYLSSLFTSTAPTIQARSVSGLESVCQSGVACVCMLSTAGPLTISQTQTATRCLYASDATGTGAISIGASTTVAAYSLSTTGDCSNSGCAGADVTLTRPYSSYQPAANYASYQAIDTAAPGWTQPACATITPTKSTFQTAAASASSTTITATSATTVTANEIVVDYTNPGDIPAGTYAAKASSGTSITVSKAVNVAKGDTIYVISTVALQPGLYSSSCTSQSPYIATTASPPIFTVSGSATTWTFAAGVYYFSGISLNIASGNIECVNGATACVLGTNGLTILLTPAGGTIGNLYFCTMSGATCGSATGAKVLSTSFNAQPTVSGNTVLNGVLFYRETGGAAGSSTAPAAWIWGTSSTTMNGAMYFPGAYATFGNPGTSSTCAAVIAGYLTLADTTTSTSNTDCSPEGVTLPQAEAARMVE